MNALDLIIVAPELVAIEDVMQRLDDVGGRAEILVDRRRGERRHADSPASAERRQRDRRQHDIAERLQRDGCVVVPAEERHA